MTAVCGLPAGWQQFNDPEGRPYYVNTETHEPSRQRPGGLPQGWREAKDPDGKVFYVHDALQLASWYRPGEQPHVRRPRPVTVTSQSTLPITAPSSSNIVVQYSKPSTTVEMPIATVVKPTTAVITPSTSAQVTLGGVTEATINLLDPTEGGIVRNTKIAAHMIAQGVNSVVKKVTNNRRLKNFAKGTGLTAANRKVKKAWKNAEQAVDSSDKRVVTVNIAEVFTEGIVVEEYEEGLEGQEYPHGTIERHDVCEKSRIHPSAEQNNLGQQGKFVQQHPYHLQQLAIQQQIFSVQPETYLDQGIAAEQDVYIEQNISVIDNEIGLQNVGQELAVEQDYETEQDFDVEEDYDTEEDYDGE
jgi:WW domain